MPGGEMMTEGNHFGDFVKDMVSTNMCVEQITVTGGKFHAGTVLCKNGTKWQEVDAGADDFCVLMGKVDATDEDKSASGLMRLAVVKSDHLEWPEGFAEADKTAIVEKMKAVHLLAQ